MKKLIIILFLQTFFVTNAQKELWGVNTGIDDGNPNSTGYKGNITKFDINGENATIMHEFTDIATGKTPKGKLFLASNGKLYGRTVAGGDTANGNIENGFGVLFEYDLILNKYKIVHLFNTQAPNAIFGTGLIEPLPDKLYGGLNNKVFCFNYQTETFSYLNSSINNSVIDGNLFKASNSYLYGTTVETFCPSGTYTGDPNFGTIIKINTANNTVQQVYQLNCDSSEGIRFSGNLQEIQTGKLNGVIAGGQVFTNTDHGNIFEFDISTNTLTKKFDFDGNNLGEYPKEIINSGNGTQYGICLNGGTNIYTNVDNGNTITNHWGTLFQYNSASNVVTKLHDFGNQQGPPFFFTGGNPTSIMKTSTGNYFGTMPWGLYKFNPVDNSVIMPIPPGCATCVPNAFVTESLIEICRKPSYKEFLPSTYSPEQGTAFTFNVQNTNATTYVWKKGTVVLPAQTTGILNFPSITASNTGVYTCTMTNECGETVTMPLNINVTNLGTDSIDNYKELISLFPNPTKGIINLKFPENRGLKAVKYKITNLLGQVVLENDIAKNNTATSITIETASFANGIYQVTLTTDKGNWNGKFLKQ
jgi:Secretion system C-terminal sorting domain